jgi:hypothetical protein
VQFGPETDGIRIAIARNAMTNIFMAGADLIRWEIVALGNGGPYQLSVLHPRGRIVEYFTTTDAALRREQEIESLFLAATASDSANAWAS